MCVSLKFTGSIRNSVNSAWFLEMLSFCSFSLIMRKPSPVGSGNQMPGVIPALQPELLGIDEPVEMLTCNFSNIQSSVPISLS